MGNDATTTVKVVTFRLSEIELEKLDNLAESESRSRSSLLVRLVKSAIRAGKSSFFAHDYSQMGTILNSENTLSGVDALLAAPTPADTRQTYQPYQPINDDADDHIYGLGYLIPPEEPHDE